MNTEISSFSEQELSEAISFLRQNDIPGSHLHAEPINLAKGIS
jgi:hypothetical protein